jgi:ADP-heptose:LPS heptosyltransferase
MSSRLTDFEETLGIIDNLDILITSCTSVGHAAASMGKRVIIITPISAYYTWCHTTKQSPWYGDNLTLLRQQKPRVWDEPIKELKEVLNGEFGNQ